MRAAWAIPLFLGLSGPARAQDPDPKKQQERIEALEKTVQELQRDAAKTRDVQTPPAEQGQRSPVRDRQTLNDQQEGAPRAAGATLDPQYLGFWAVPNTPVIMKFNAKPRVDFTRDNRNPGDDNRFVTARIPVEGSPAYGGGSRSNINAKGSQLRLDVRAPSVAGSPRFYYQNDFYGSGPGEFPYRIQQLYGQIYNIVVGQTYSVFEDPDVWPDTVDYEGPNSMIFARRALVRYEAPLGEALGLNLGIEQPESLPADLVTGDPDGVVSGINHVPDFTANLRFENEDLGHAQLAGIFRYLGADSSVFGRDEVAAWGVNASASVNVAEGTTLLLQVTVGEGIGTLGNDTSFFNTDAAFDASGDLVALPYVAYMAAVTHRWSEDFRSTVSYGFVRLDDGDALLDPGTYDETRYASGNLIWQLKKRLSVGAELLYGRNELQSGDDGEVLRVHIGLVYAIFD